MTTLRRRTNSERDLEPRSVSCDPTKFALTNKGQHNQVLSTLCNMACRDRTGEFISVVRNKEGRLKDTFLPSKKPKHIKASASWTNFREIAAQIGRDIGNTYKKLEKLTLLAKKRSLFDDKPVEIQELTYIVTEDINSLNKQIAQLQQLSKSRNQNQGKHMLSHTNSVVLSLQSKLAAMSTNFRHVLEVRTENLKHEKHRREKFSEGMVSATMPSGLSGHSGSVLLSDDHLASTNPRSDFTINMENEQFQHQLQLIDHQDSYIQDRADTMQNIEATIVELGTIFNQLANMVKEQEEIVQRIDHNVEDAQLNVESAHSEILKYFQSVTSNRWLMIKVFAVLIVFFIIFVVFVA